jgi:UDP-N-acetyl-D-galactosamine dehydrogenase
MYGHHAQIINSGRSINDGMGAYVAKQVIIKLANTFPVLKECRILVMGTTFKENVSDIRNSKIVDVVNELKSFGISVDIIDPHASAEEVKEEYNLVLENEVKGPYHAVIVAVSHDEYSNLSEDYFKSITVPGAILADLKSIYRDKIKFLTYWSL